MTNPNSQFACAPGRILPGDRREEVVAALQREKVLPVATDLITQFNPAIAKHDLAVRALESIATKVAPALGWRPAPRYSSDL